MTLASSRPNLRPFAFCLLPLAACLLCSCGRKGPVRPPEDIRPTSISDLTASSTPKGIQLSWSRPRTYTGGAQMSDLGGFVVERAAGTDPLVPFERLVVLEVTDRDRYRQIKRFSYVDTDTTVETPYRYRVVSFTTDRYFSAPSNVVSMQRAPTTEESHAPLPTPRR
jgi:predicted small lipoprotein YifL